MNNYLIDTFVYLNKNSISHELCDDLIKLFEEETDGKYEGVTASGLNKDIKDTTDFIITKINEKWSKMYDFLEKEQTGVVRNSGICYKIHHSSAGVAQLVEHPTCNRTVEGSSPLASILFSGVSHSGNCKGL